MTRNELVVAAKAAGIEKAHSMKSVVLEEMLSNMSKPESTGKRGRPVDENSVRQLRLNELEAKRANGELKLVNINNNYNIIIYLRSKFKVQLL